MEEPEPGNKEMLGTPIAEYRDEIVALDVLVGFIFFAGCGLVLAACLVADRHFIMYSLIGLVLFGALVVGVTKSVSRNRLLIYPEGLVQITRGQMEKCLWKDLRTIEIREEQIYSSGLAFATHRHCVLRRRDGSEMKVHAVKITPAVLKTIKEACRMDISTEPAKTDK
jgi:hypothetical protein